MSPNMRPGISEKLLVLLVMPLVAIAVLALWQLRVSLGDAALLQLKGQMLQLVQRYAAEVATQLEQAVVIADSTADILAVNPTHDPEKLFSLLEHNLDRLSIIYGSAVAFEPGEFPGKRLYSPYVYRGENRSKARMDIAVDGYDYTEPEWQWWNAPRNERRGTWTDPYFDEGAGNILMVTCSAPILDQQRFIGVATVDIDLAALHANLNLEGLRDSDYVILTRTGFFAYHYRKEMIGQSFTRLIDKLGLESSAYIERQMLAGESGFFEYAHDGTTDWVFYAPVGHLGWSFAVRVNLDDALQLAKMDAKPVYLWTVVIAVAALLLTWLAARMLLVSPLQQLRAGIDGLRAGAAPQLPQQLGSRQLDDLRDTLEASVTEVRQSAAEQAQQIESLNGMLVKRPFSSRWRRNARMPCWMQRAMPPSCLTGPARCWPPMTRQRRCWDAIVTRSSMPVCRAG